MSFLARRRLSRDDHKQLPNNAQSIQLRSKTSHFMQSSGLLEVGGGKKVINKNYGLLIFQPDVLLIVVELGLRFCEILNDGLNFPFTQSAFYIGLKN